MPTTARRKEKLPSIKSCCEALIGRIVVLMMRTNKDQCLDIATEKDYFGQKNKQLVVKKYNLELAILHEKDKVMLSGSLRHLKDSEGSSLRKLLRLTGTFL